MKLSELEKVLELYIGNPNAPAIMLVSEAGIGKSSFVEQFGKKHGYRVHIFRGAEHDATDLIGMPEVVTDEKGNKITKFIPPDWVPRDDEKFIFFADEINRARIDVRQACFRLAEMRGTETWKINRKNHMVILAVNPDDGDFQVEQLDPAFINRPSIFYIEPDVDDWIKWAFENGINKHIINFIQTNRSMLYVKPPSDYGIKQYPTPRSWANASAILNRLNIESGQQLPEFTISILTGNVGIEAATAFANFITDPDQPIDAEDIVNNFDEKLKEKFIRHQSSTNTVSKAMVAVLNLVGYITVKDLTKEQLENIRKFYECIKSDDIKVAFIKGIGDKLQLIAQYISPDELVKLSKDTTNKMKKLKK